MRRRDTTVSYWEQIGSQDIVQHMGKTWCATLSLKLTLSTVSQGYQFLSYSDNCFERLFRRRQLTDQVDISLLRAWISECRHNHLHSTSYHPLEPQRLRSARFRLIDVVENRLIEPSIACRYVALSYVWGTWMANQGISRVPDLDDGTITTDNMPQTIKDAIFLTHLLGERYL